MSILQGHVMSVDYPPGYNCLVATVPGAFSPNTLKSQTEATEVNYGSCSMSCIGDIAVVAHSSSLNVANNEILTFRKINSLWTLVDTKVFDFEDYSFSGKSFFRNNDRIKLSGDGTKLFIALEGNVGYGTNYRIVKYTWNGTTWADEQIIALPDGVAKIGVISVSYDGQVIACSGLTAGDLYVHMIWDTGLWVMVKFTTYPFYFIYGGVAMSSDGMTAAFGSSGGSEGNEVDQPVKVYTEINTNWVEVGSLSPPGSGTAGFSYFGACLALNAIGNVLAIGAPLYDNGVGDLEAGKVYIANLIV